MTVADLDHSDSLGLLSRQTRVLELVAGGTALPAVLDAVVESLEELMPGTHCSVLLLDADSGTLRHGAAPTLPRAYSAGIDGLAIGHDAGSCGAAAFLDAEVVAEDITRDARWDRYRGMAVPHGLRACWSSPIRGRTGPERTVLGTFAVYHGVPHSPTVRERLLVARFTHLASVAIEHERLHGAESASRAKSEFLSALGHEMRTPLQAITGFAELLGTLDLPGDRRLAALDHIAGAATHILSLVDDLLDVARIEAGALPVTIDHVPVDEVAAEVVALLAPEAGRRGIGVAATASGLAVRADRRRLRQVLINLVANGVRHNRPDGRVDVDAVREGADVVLRVADTGPGIAPEMLDRLFVAFDRLDATETPGTGLGMTLARGLTEAMGGSLTVTSALGTGTTMSVRIPAARSGDPRDVT